MIVVNRIDMKRAILICALISSIIVMLIYVFLKGLDIGNTTSITSVQTASHNRIDAKELDENSMAFVEEVDAERIVWNNVSFFYTDINPENVVVDDVIYLMRNNRLYRRDFIGPALASWFGAKADGKSDDTKALQKLLNSSVDSIKLDGKEYRVSKNESLVGFPMGDQPCLLIRGRKNLYFDGGNATIFVDQHAQGILEIQQSEDIKVINLHVNGSRNFPFLDKGTGRAEKGTAVAG